MANRDQNQKVAFVYSNIYQLYKKAQAAASTQQANEVEPNARVFRADELAGIKITSFQPAEFKGATAPSSASPSPAEQKGRRDSFETPFEDLKNNIARLQDLHSRLRFMLSELEGLVEKKKR